MVQTRRPPIFLYDGDCSFCSSCARFIERRIPGPAAIAAWQHVDLAPLGVTVEMADTSVVWVEGPGVHTTAARAIADLLRSSTSVLWRTAGRLLALPPVLWVAEPVYRWIAANRHRMPGGTATCSLPHAERERVG